MWLFVYELWKGGSLILSGPFVCADRGPEVLKKRERERDKTMGVRNLVPLL